MSNEANAALELAQQNAANIAANSASLAQITYKVSSDLLNWQYSYPWNLNAVAGGTTSTSNTLTTSKHPGVVAYFCHASNTNSGIGCRISSNVLIGGGEISTVCFATASTITGITRRIGFHTATDQNVPTDGVYCSIIDGVMYGRCANNSVLSTTASNYTLAASTWYRLVIQLNSDATLATFTLYKDDSNIILWQDSLNTNIPKTRFVQHGDITTSATPSGVVSIGSLDYVDIILPSARRIE